MKILIHLTSDSELIAYEALSLAFTFATFDHKVELLLSGNSQTLLTDHTSRLYGMIQSLDLYDIPKAWHEFASLDELDDDIKGSLNDNSLGIDKLIFFDSIIRF